jgi:hypothetical protein
VTSDGGSEEDVRLRIRKANGADNFEENKNPYIEH